MTERNLQHETEQVQIYDGIRRRK